MEEMLIMQKDGVVLMRRKIFNNIPNTDNFVFINKNNYKVINVVFDYDNYTIKVYVEPSFFNV